MPVHRRLANTEKEREIDVDDDRRLTLNGQSTCAPFRVVKSNEKRDTGRQYDENNQHTDRIEDAYPTTVMDNPLDAFWTRVAVDTPCTIDLGADHDGGKCKNLVYFRDESDGDE